MGLVLVWIRNDFRLDDHSALHFASQSGHQTMPVYIRDSQVEHIGEASQWWLHQSIDRFKADLQKLGSNLVVRSGTSLEVLRDLIESSKATHLYFNRRIEPELLRLDHEIASELEDKIEVKTFPAAFLLEPGRIVSGQGSAFKVFTPFFNSFLKTLAEEKINPLPTVKNLEAPSSWPLSEELAGDWERTGHWSKKFSKYWSVGESSALRLWKDFHKDHLQNYPHDRDYPSKGGSSRLSPYLHFGQISVRRIFEELQVNLKKSSSPEFIFLRQLIWREFCASCLMSFKNFSTESYIEKFKVLSWSEDRSHLKAWQDGRTGYPIVDAGMRELWETGSMHNRVRMIVGSFLVKHLQQNWTNGADWFWDTLLDADLANNSFGWQWVASTGLDPVPYFRIFNPVLQSQKFDPDGNYIRRWVPELKNISNKEIHSPWKSTPLALKAAGIVLGRDYPKPLVDHSAARLAALRLYSLKKD